MRNVVLITFDSLRADHCSFLGYGRKTTPTLDRMAKDGLFFENAIASGVPTAPSMMGVFTGEYALAAGDDLTGEHWRRDMSTRRTLAQVLSEKGYATGAFHANPFVSDHFGFNKGFINFQDRIKEDFKRKASSRSQLILRHIEKIVKKEVTCLPWEKLYEPIVDWVRKSEKPYFLWVLLLDTHTPYLPPKKNLKWSRKGFIHLLYWNWKMERQGWKIEGKGKEHIINAYDDAIFYADNFVMKLWDDLIDDDPIFIVHADHGDGFGEHGFYQHAPPLMLYEELIHVPLIIYNADVKERIKKPVSLLGLSPTILDLVRNGWGGEEFRHKNLLDCTEKWVISTGTSNNIKKVAVRGDEWKFILGQKDMGELYNLKADPMEQKNLIEEECGYAKDLKEIAIYHIKREEEIRKTRMRISKLKVSKKI